MANPPTTSSRSSSSSSSSSTSRTSSGGGDDHGSGVGVSISREGVEVSNNGVGVSVGEHSVGASREFDIWEGTVAPIPTGVPGIFVTLTPAVKAQVSGSLNFEGRTEVTVGGRITGSLMVGLEGGAPPAASIYLRGGPVLTGSLTMTVDRSGVKTVEGRIDLDMAARIGVQVQHVLDYGIDLGSARMFSFVGISYDRTRSPRFQYGTFQLGPPLRTALDWLHSAVDRVVSLGGRAVDTIRGYMSGAASTVARGASAAYEWITSW